MPATPAAGLQALATAKKANDKDEEARAAKELAEVSERISALAI